MMELKKYFRIFILLLFANLIGCSNLGENVVVQKEYVYNKLILQERPEEVILYDISFNVVTENNIKEFLEKNRQSEGAIVFIAVSVSDYEKLSLNVGEIKRYILQQKSLIIYYEDVIKNNNKTVGN